MTQRHLSVREDFISLSFARRRIDRARPRHADRRAWCLMNVALRVYIDFI